MSIPQYGERVEFGPDDVCYRHPKVHSFTLCQRCGRTVCPECQIVSPVGVLCPECVREARGSATQRAGRRARAGARGLLAEGTPVVTYALMIACVLVWVAQLLGGWFGSDGVTQALWYAPAYSLPDAVSGQLYSNVSFEPWRMLTAMFTHATSSPLHILFNMLALWLFGRNLEQLVGRVAFLVLYVFAGLGGSLGVMLWAYADPQAIGVPTVGASGAIFGVLAATVVAYRAARVNITSLVVLLALNLAIGFLPGAAVSWQAHLGGLLIGALTMWALLATRGPRKRNARLWALVALGAVLVALSAMYWLVLPLAF